MINITKEFNFAMAHLLEGHNGLCANIHGHNYKLFVTVQRHDEDVIEKDTSDNGMVIDFKELKDAVNICIIDEFDHAFAFNNRDEESCEIAKYLSEKMKQKLIGLSFRATAENMSEFIFNELNEFLYNTGTGIKCVKIVLYETDTSYATYEESDCACNGKVIKTCQDCGETQ